MTINLLSQSHAFVEGDLTFALIDTKIHIHTYKYHVNEYVYTVYKVCAKTIGQYRNLFNLVIL